MSIFNELFRMNNYAMNSYALAVLIVSFLILWLGVMMYRSDPKDPKNKTAFCFHIGLFLWLFFFATSVFSTNVDVVYFWFKYCSYPAVIYLSFLMYLFVLSWSKELYSRRKWLLWLFFVVFTVNFVGNFATDLFLVPGAEMFNFGYAVNYDLLGIVFIALWMVPFIVSMKDLYYLKRTSKDPLFVRSIKVIIIGLWILFTATFDYAGGIFPELDLYPSGYISMFLFAVVNSFAIARYHFMDIKTTVHKMLMWIVTSVLIVLPFGIVFFYFFINFPNLNPLILVLFVIVGFYVFDWVKSMLQPKIEDLLRMGKKEYKTRIAALNEKVFASKTIEELVRSVFGGLYDLCYMNNIHYYVFNEGSCMFTATMKNGDIIQIKNTEQKDIPSAFEAFLEDKKLQQSFEGKNVFYRQECTRLEESEKKKGIMDLFSDDDVEIVILVRHEGEIVSFITLGKKENEKFYSREELDLFEGVGGSVGVVTKSLLSFENILAKEKNLKVSLEKEVSKRAKELIRKNEELESFQQKTIDRELKMIKLKERIGELEAQVAE